MKNMSMTAPDRTPSNISMVECDIAALLTCLVAATIGAFSVKTLGNTMPAMALAIAGSAAAAYAMSFVYGQIHQTNLERVYREPDERERIGRCVRALRMVIVGVGVLVGFVAAAVVSLAR
jgi:NADH:ubiquinone oxidoreductase subunit 2 (subunit N)